MSVRFASFVGLFASGAALLLAGSAFAFAPPEAPPGQASAEGNSAGGFDENATSGVIEGAFVSLAAPAAGALVANYTSEGLLIIDALEVAGYQLQETMIQGAQLRVVGSGASARVHDSKNAVLKVELEFAAVGSFRFADGVTVGPGPEGSFLLSFDGSNRTAALWTNCGAGAASLAGGGGGDDDDDGGSLDYRVDVAAADPCDVFLRFRVEPPPPGAVPSPETAIDRAIEAGHLAAEVTVGEDAADRDDVALYADIEVLVGHADDRIVVSIQSQGPASVLVRFTPPGEGADLEILIDGRPPAFAGGFEDAMNASDDGGQVEVNFERDGSGSLVVISVPDPQSHVVEIRTAVAAGPAPPPQASVYAVLAAIAITAAAAFLLFRRLD
jgi:hypothetical protein